MFAFVLAGYGAWWLYIAGRSFVTQLPMAGILMLTNSLIAFSVCFCIRKRKWRMVFWLIVLLYVTVDLSAVFIAARQ